VLWFFLQSTNRTEPGWFLSCFTQFSALNTLTNTNL
jgi:hypothetical protein